MSLTFGGKGVAGFADACSNICLSHQDLGCRRSLSRARGTLFEKSVTALSHCRSHSLPIAHKQKRENVKNK
jgi:hypothetical protein